MAFDARSLERLRQLGRTLPQPLPTPQPPAAIGHSASSPSRPESNPLTSKASDRRHPVETEQNPEQLFRELMRVSPDGTVPPHLLERLKQAEASQREPRRTTPATNDRPGPAGSAGNRPGAIRKTGSGRPRSAGTAAEQELYSAFEQWLLENDDQCHPQRQNQYT